MKEQIEQANTENNKIRNSNVVDKVASIYKMDDEILEVRNKTVSASSNENKSKSKIND